ELPGQALPPSLLAAIRLPANRDAIIENAVNGTAMNQWRWNEGTDRHTPDDFARAVAADTNGFLGREAARGKDGMAFGDDTADAFGAGAFAGPKFLTCVRIIAGNEIGARDEKLVLAGHVQHDG